MRPLASHAQACFGNVKLPRRPLSEDLEAPLVNNALPGHSGLLVISFEASSLCAVDAQREGHAAAEAVKGRPGGAIGSKKQEAKKHKHRDTPFSREFQKMTPSFLLSQSARFAGA